MERERGPQRTMPRWHRPSIFKEAVTLLLVVALLHSSSADQNLAPGVYNLAPQTVGNGHVVRFRRTSAGVVSLRCTTCKGSGTSLFTVTGNGVLDLQDMSLEGEVASSVAQLYGAISATDSATVKLTNVEITNFGRGIRLSRSASVDADGLTCFGNGVSAALAGTLGLNGDSSPFDGACMLMQESATATFRTSKFVANRAASMLGSCGGAISAQQSSALTVTDSEFTANTAPSGGAICGRGPVLTNVTRTAFRGNYGNGNSCDPSDKGCADVYGGGGAFALSEHAMGIINSCTFVNNSAPVCGTVWLRGPGGSLDVTSSTFDNSSAVAIIAPDTLSSRKGSVDRATLLDEQITKDPAPNPVYGGGGGLPPPGPGNRRRASPGPQTSLTMTNCTLFNSCAKRGSGIAVTEDSTVVLRNCILDRLGDSGLQLSSASVFVHLFVDGAETRVASRLDVDGCEIRSMASDTGNLFRCSGSDVRVSNSVLVGPFSYGDEGKKMSASGSFAGVFGFYSNAQSTLTLANVRLLRPPPLILLSNLVEYAIAVHEGDRVAISVDGAILDNAPLGLLAMNEGAVFADVSNVVMINRTVAGVMGESAGLLYLTKGRALLRNITLSLTSGEMVVVTNGTLHVFNVTANATRAVALDRAVIFMHPGATSASPSVTIDGATVLDALGGFVRVDAGSTALSHVRTDGLASYAVLSASDAISVTLTSSMLLRSTFRDGAAGAADFGVVIVRGGSVIISRSVFVTSTTRFVSVTAGAVEISNSTFAESSRSVLFVRGGNTTASGCTITGAARNLPNTITEPCVRMSNNALFTLANSSVQNCWMPRAEGGFVKADGSSVLVLKSVSVSNCTAQVGAVVHASESANVSIAACTFGSSVATFYGAVVLSGTGVVGLIDGTLFVQNSARSYGSALVVENGALITVVRSEFLRCFVTASSGAAVVAAPLSSLTMIDSVIRGCRSARAGAALSVQFNATVELTRVHVTGNSASRGAAMLVLEDALVTANACEFSSNEGTSGDGGGVVVDAQEARLLFTRCVFAGNTCGVDGGAAYFGGSADVRIADCLFGNNTARSGGAIFVTDSANVLVSATTFRLSRAEKYGGSIQMEGVSELRAQNVSFIDSAAGLDGGIAFLSDSAHLVLNGGAVVRATAGRDGGGIAFDVDHFAATARMGGFRLSNIYASGRGGLAYVRPVVSGDLSITNCSATNITSGDSGTLIYTVSDVLVVFNNVSVDGVSLESIYSQGFIVSPPSSLRLDPNTTSAVTNALSGGLFTSASWLPEISLILYDSLGTPVPDRRLEERLIVSIRLYFANGTMVGERMDGAVRVGGYKMTGNTRIGFEYGKSAFPANTLQLYVVPGTYVLRIISETASYTSTKFNVSLPVTVRRCPAGRSVDSFTLSCVQCAAYTYSITEEAATCSAVPTGYGTVDGVTVVPCNLLSDPSVCVGLVSGGGADVRVLVPAILIPAFSIICVGAALYAYARRRALAELQKARNWVIDVSEIEMGDLIGEGTFGVVYRGIWRGSVVAIKMLRSNARSSQMSLPKKHRPSNENVHAGAAIGSAVSGADGTKGSSVSRVPSSLSPLLMLSEGDPLPPGVTKSMVTAAHDEALRSPSAVAFGGVGAVGAPMPSPEHLAAKNRLRGGPCLSRRESDAGGSSERLSEKDQKSERSSDHDIPAHVMQQLMMLSEGDPLPPGISASLLAQIQQNADVGCRYESNATLFAGNRQQQSRRGSLAVAEAESKAAAPFDALGVVTGSMPHDDHMRTCLSSYGVDQASSEAVEGNRVSPDGENTSGTISHNNSVPRLPGGPAPHPPATYHSAGGELAGGTVQFDRPSTARMSASLPANASRAGGVSAARHTYREMVARTAVDIPLNNDAIRTHADHMRSPRLRKWLSSAVAWLGVNVGRLVSPAGSSDVRASEVGVGSSMTSGGPPTLTISDIVSDDTPSHSRGLLPKRKSVDERALAEFIKEIEIMCALRHPNIVIMMGACVKKPDVCIVAEYMANGSVYDVYNMPGFQMDWRVRIAFALDAAHGMEFLHLATPPILHLDLKSLNLLVDDRHRVKVSDFGLAAMKQQSTDAKVATRKGSILWMAPEICRLEPGCYSEKADVYSFGIILWELIYSQLPYAHHVSMGVPALMMAIGTDGLRPPMRYDVPSAFQSLVRDCWAPDAQRRPSFSVITRSLASFAPATWREPKVFSK